MPVYQDKKTKLWYFRCYVNNTNGKRKQYQRCGFKTKRDAQATERDFISKEISEDTNIIKQEPILNNTDNNEVLNNIQELEEDSNSIIYFSELWDNYNSYIKLKLKKQSYRKIASKFKNHIIPYFSKYRIDKINSRIYTDWQIKIEQNGYSYKYLSSLHGAMVTILNYGIKFYDLEYNIASKVGNFSKKNIKPSRVDFWTYEEFKKFIDCVEEIDYNTFYKTLFFTGMRQGEALALTWKDIQDGYIDIYKTIAKEKEDEKHIINTPKTKSSIRKIRIDNNLINDLNNLKEHYKRIIDFSDDWFVFGGIEPLSPTTIGRKKDNYCVKAGVKKIRIHDFRHSHASLLLSKNVPITVISERLGHSDINMTLNTYSHMIPKDEDKAIYALETLAS